MKRPYDKQEIAHLLDKFMAGETTLNEEQTLATYFRTHEVDEEWKEYKEMFALFDNGQVEAPCSPPTRDELRDNLSLPIGGSRRANHIPLWPLAAVVAACILLLLVVRFSQEPEEGQPVVAEVIEPEAIKQRKPQPVPQPIVEEKKEEVLAEVQPTPQPAKKRRKVVRKKSTPIEPSAMETTNQAEKAEPALAYCPAESVPSSDDFSPIQDIRSRGERLQRMVDAIIIE